MMITSLYAALLACWLVILSIRVIALRGNPVFKIFGFRHAGEASLERAVRAHGNFTEYTPIFLIMLFLAEQQGISPMQLHGLAMAFSCGRLMHGICFSFLAQNMFLRVCGTVLTLFPILGLAVRLLSSG